MGIVITVSRQLGAGGENVACEVAQTLGLRVVGQEIIREAMRAGVPEEIAMESEEGKRSWIQRALHWLDRVQGVPTSPGALMEGHSAYISTGLPSSEEYYRSVMESIIFDLTYVDEVLLLGRAGQMIFRDHPDCFHVRIVAPMEKRIPVIEQRFGASPEEARRRIADSDRARAGFLRRYYSVDIDDAQLYDLCINTGTVREDAAVRLIVDAVRAADRALCPRRERGTYLAVRETDRLKHVLHGYETFETWEVTTPYEN